MHAIYYCFSGMIEHFRTCPCILCNSVPSALLSNRSILNVATPGYSDGNSWLNSSPLCQRGKQNSTKAPRGTPDQATNSGTASRRHGCTNIPRRTQAGAQAGSSGSNWGPPTGACRFDANHKCT
uniref:Lipid transfer protein n=1 Tax=Rhizophora mucronata TaxID=61149 RepID=A0A2P2PP28_RHIMU